MFAMINYPQGAGKQYEQFRYPGGEVQVRLTAEQIDILKSVGYGNVCIVARITDGDITPVLQLVYAVRGVTGSNIKLILPYLPYSRADRRFTEGDTCGLAVFASTLNAMHGVEIITLDAHSKAAAVCLNYFTNVEPTPIIDSVIDRLDGTRVYGTSIITTGVLLPDKGAADRYGYGGLHATKLRDPQTGKLSGFSIPPRSEFKCDNILIVDDICDGGGTFIGIADQLKDYGLPLYLYVTHGIFSQGYNNLFDRFKRVFTTDSFKLVGGEYGQLTVIPCMGTILDKIALRNASPSDSNWRVDGGCLCNGVGCNSCCPRS